MLFKAAIAYLDYTLVQERILYYKFAVANGILLPSIILEDVTGQQADYLVANYVALARDVGGWPWPDMLRNLGWAGHLIHAVCCTRAGLWAAFTELVMRSHPEAPFLIPQEEKDEHPDSIPEEFVCRRVRLLPGIVSVEMHPELPGGLSKMIRADLLVTAATGRKKYVELTMVPFDAQADNKVYIKYRSGLAKKEIVYKSLGLEPFMIWADQAASPRALEEALNNLLAQLDLPTRPPSPPAWFEIEVV